MKSDEIRSRFLNFFQERDHVILDSAPLVSSDEQGVTDSTLFNTAGVQPLVPYLLGQKHPRGNRLASAQKCLRTVDLDEVGDATHLTFFEMLGNWSLGDYFKNEAIHWSYNFLTDHQKGLGLDPQRLYVTVFAGDGNAPRDDEAYQIWEEIFSNLGMDPERRIFFMDATSNWWEAGENGPCGPDTEMFYDVSGKLTDGLTSDEFIAADERQDIVEIWNDVFMQFEKANGKIVGPLSQHAVDTGTGLERLAMTIQGVDNVFDTDIFTDIMADIKRFAAEYDERSARIIADHLRTACFLLSEGVIPSNTDRGYVLRRIIRRAIRYARKISLDSSEFLKFAEGIVGQYSAVYPELSSAREKILSELVVETQRFADALVVGERELVKLAEKIKIEEGGARQHFTGAEAFDLYQTHGLPVEMIREIAHEINFTPDDIDPVPQDEFQVALTAHQTLSKVGAEQKFRGGLVDDSARVTALHTVTHLLLAALRTILGDHVHQAGSNITSERIRFDFTHPEKLDEETLRKVEDFVNDSILADCVVEVETLPKTEARNSPDIEGSFWERYPEAVLVWTIRDAGGTIYSRELCGGPHVENTSQIAELGAFKIKKEESSAAGVRRIKAVLG